MKIKKIKAKNIKVQIFERVLTQEEIKEIYLKTCM